MSDPRNCHYISRLLTKPWETKQRELVYFDVESKRIDRHSSKSLFARDALNAPDIERRLNQLMETPLGKNREEIVIGQTEVSDWRAYRAIALLLMLQPVRSAAALEAHDHGDRLGEILRLPDDQLDQLILRWLEKHRLVRYGIPDGERLFFPSTGIFALPIVDAALPQHFDFAFGVPVHPRVFVAHLSETADIDGLAKFAEAGNFHAAASVGLHSDFVVLPPSLIEINTEKEIGDAISGWRESSRSLVRNISKAQTLMKTAWEQYGLKLSTDALSRKRKTTPPADRESD